MNIVFLHTGSNLGNRFDYLHQANQLIKNRIGSIQKASSFYETAAWGITDQPAFINQAIRVETALSPNELLKAINQIEAEIGRIRIKKWAERVIDIDILFYNQTIIETPNLKVPHPRISERNFVLVPMNEIAADFVHPVFQKTMQQLLDETSDNLEAKKIEEKILK
ncbi:MAG: 2-amino-4-hydroxy-6-hydroxymethyldihydropteridine diphosphokinase [Saprospiraceae bacterium]